ncbi:uncharacterized protein MYCFIDRAFT_79874 [Pseudocercospora fijiensis CIRAD86]|uniref:Peptidase metallopeptidase domain-containing protein n=1 Tax=Pseudocercospora fijiensis (strain CIRAD86) TaxID=383855 RepID=M2YML6_PSEFD|nr:uncharacterized protein MYCFIDRAFT_79874 [Pseudocercospora fijiensis CIRAD86]EME78990.1 hypothetical protein MYCFIDRAFT_79874 [Pseudocercospora fijiensis CIRAD86]
MRTPPALPSLLLTSTTLSTLACPSPKEHILKRWYSVWIPAEGDPRAIGAWPVVEGRPGSPRIQPVRYCWATEADYETLHDLFIQAVAKWKIAIITSALRIQSDTGTESEPHKKCICSDSGVRDDALRISDMTGGNEYPNSAGVATLGYHYVQSHAGRHFLKFCRSVDAGFDSLSMAHEIGTAWNPDSFALHVSQADHAGHVIGLLHEQARPDASKWIEFRCENLIDYEAAKKRIGAANNGHTIKDA